MYKPPRWYYRGETVGFVYSDYCILAEKPIITHEDKQNMLDIIKKMYVAYWKFLKDYLKENGIYEYYPVNIFRIAVEKGYINKSELKWLDFIKLLNKMLHDKDADQNAIADEIIEVYSKEMSKINDYSVNLCKDVYDNGNEISSLELPFEKPAYTPEEIGIEEYAYKILINYFINNPYIEYVWIHGSRAIGQGKYNSDVDLLVKCPLDIQRQLAALRVPYRIDVSNIYDYTKKVFLYKTAQYAKIIYRREDFFNTKNNV